MSSRVIIDFEKRFHAPVVHGKRAARRFPSHAARDTLAARMAIGTKTTRKLLGTWAIYMGFAVSTSVGTIAHAEPSDQELLCLESYEQTQEARQAGNLLRARKLTESCVVEACHEVIRTSCQTWRRELKSEVPSIVVRALDEKDKPIGGATVLVDGKEKLSSAGRRLELDPGTHSVRMSAEGFEPAEMTFELAAGEQGLPIELSLEKLPSSGPTEAPASRKRRGPLWPTIVLAGVGATGFSALGIYGSKARASDRDLDTCADTRTCDQDQVDAIKADYTIANVGLGVGIFGVAGAIGYGVFALQPKKEKRVGLWVSPRFVGARGSF